MHQFIALSPAKPLATLILAHGAGAPMDSDFMNLLCQTLRDNGVATVRFEFPYMAQRRLTGKKRPPDREPVLLQCWRDVYSQVKHNHGAQRPLLIGGKSMGGRMASLVAEELQVDAFCCFGYPFSPPGKPGKIRTGHFANLTVPGLILQGTRDVFGKEDEVDTSTWPASLNLVWLNEGDHDYRARKSSGLTQAEIICKAASRAAAFAKENW